MKKINPILDEILIVDDETANLKLLKDLLSREGYEVRPADRPQLAINSALAKPPALILLDVRMPEMDGFEVCKRLKQDSRTGDIPIIFISALQDVKDKIRGFEAGGVDYITKPFQEAEILARVRTHIQLHRMQQNLEQLVEERTFELNESRFHLKQKVQKLQESEERYGLTVAGSTAGLWDWDITSNKVYYANRFKELLGYAPDEFGDTPEDFFDRLHPDDYDTIRLAVDKHLKEKIPYKVEYRLQTKLGEYKWFHARAQALWDKKGIATRMSGSIVDISERKQIEEGLYKSKEFNQAVLMSLPSHIAVLDREGNILTVNDAWIQFARRNDAIYPDAVGPGVNYLKICQEASDNGDETITTILDGIRSVMDGSLTFFETEYPCHSPSEKHWFMMTVLPFKGLKGGTIVSHTNITAIVQAEKKMQESERKFRHLVEDINDVIYSVDTEGRVVYVSPVIKSLIGYEPNEVIGKHFSSFAHSEDSEAIKKGFESALAGKVVPSDYRFLHKTGTYIWARVLSKAVKDENNNMLGIRGVMANITERKQAEIALIYERNKAQEYLNIANTIILALDTNGKVILVNKYTCDLLGYKEEEILGKDWFRTFLPNRMRKDVKVIFQQIIKGAIKSLKDVEGFSVLTKSGEEKLVTWHNSIIKDNQGKIIGTLSSGEDITEQKRAELNYRTVADFTYDWEYWANMDGTLNYVSPSCERISGYSVQDFMDNPSLFREIIVPQDHDIWDTHYQDSRRELKPREMQFRIQRRDGQICWIEHSCQPVIDDQGRLNGFRASNRDITDRKLAEIELRGAYEEIEQLKNQLEAESAYLQEEIKSDHNFENIIGNSDALKYVLLRVSEVASTDAPVLILGETGTGKELIARALHHASSRNKHALVKVNCANLPAALIESELFGHEKGAFTGADSRRIGRFQLADKATLFLDEISEIPIDLQAKLLRVLQDNEFEPIGSSKTVKTDVRIIAASNRSLDDEVNDGRFRSDLLYRINVFPITVPPLRHRKEDIPLLVNWFVDKFNRKMGKRISSIPAALIKHLQNYDWPGNIRELENVIERAVITSKNSVLKLTEKLTANSSKPGFKSNQTLSEVERNHILKTLEATGWKIEGNNGAAQMLGLAPSTIRSRMKKLGIKRPESK